MPSTPYKSVLLIVKKSKRETKDGKVKKIYKVRIRNGTVVSEENILRNRFLPHYNKKSYMGAEEALLSFISQKHGISNEISRSTVADNDVVEIMKNSELEVIEMKETMRKKEEEMQDERKRMNSLLQTSEFGKREIANSLQTTEARLFLVEKNLNNAKANSVDATTDKDKIARLTHEVNDKTLQLERLSAEVQCDYSTIFGNAQDIAKLVGIMRTRMFEHQVSLINTANQTIAFNLEAVERQKQQVQFMEKASLSLREELTRDDSIMEDVEKFIDKMKKSDHIPPEEIHCFTQDFFKGLCPDPIQTMWDVLDFGEVEMGFITPPETPL